MKLLEIKNLSVRIYGETSFVEPLSDINLFLNTKESIGIVGESGCGKTMLGLSIMRLLPKPYSKITNGSILYNGKNIVNFSDEEMRKIRGKEISLIFQEPMTSLNPVLTIGDQIKEAINAHLNFNRKEVEALTVELLKKAGIVDAENKVNSYPYELSGGMRQRAMIASALSCSPKLLIADEPTTALDVTIQSQILDLMSKLKNELDMSLILITHDFGVVSKMTTRVVVMYAGQFVEEGFTTDVFKNPKHPYTNALIKSLPKKGGGRIFTIAGRVPDLKSLPYGCRFAERCYKARNECFKTKIDYFEIENRRVRCLYPEG